MNDLHDLEEFNKKLQKARGEDPVTLEKKRQEDNESDSKKGMQAGVELVGAIFLPTLLGYYVDDWLGTRPFFTLTLLFLGIATGFYNVYRITQNMGTAVGVVKDKEPENKDKK